MSQPNLVMAFRARLVTSGYTNISISKIRRFNDQDVYRVLAVEPLAGNPVWRDMDLVEMYRWR